MTDIQKTEYKKEMDDLAEYFSRSKSDPILLKKMTENPLEVLQSMGISVEYPFKDAATIQLRAMASLTSLHLEELTPAKARIMPESDLPPEVKNALEFVVKPWGLVLVVREPAIKYLQGGGSITAGVLAAIATAAGVTGPVGIAIAVIAGICAAAFTIYNGVITMTNKGQGVYLTWTWPQFLPFIILIPPIPNPMYGIPVITPIT